MTITEHPDFKTFVGKKVNMTIKGVTYFNLLIKFIGTNAVGHNVVTTKGNGWMFHIDNWNDLKFEEI